MTKIPTVGRLIALLLVAAGPALAADQQILGRKLLVRDPTGAESDRIVIVLGRERNTAVTLVGDPTADGASLQVIANGTSGSMELLTLDAVGWSATPAGFNYVGPTTGDPVRRVILKRTPSGAALVKAVLRGDEGLTDLTVTPPDLGADGGLVLAIGGGGDRYCVSFGGAAGGTETHDDAAKWVVVAATATPGCPSSLLSTTTTSSTTTSSTLLATCGESAPACNGTCPAAYHCESVGSMCFCFTGGTDHCTTCDSPCAGSDVCTAAIDTTPPYLTSCSCVAPPACGTGVCGGNCPAGATCADPNPMGTACSCYIF